jgi:hypothetical protein
LSAVSSSLKRNIIAANLQLPETKKGLSQF